MNWTDKLTRLATGLTVAALAGVAGAISFSHMSALAMTHDQLGWKASAFPISVDGLELISSLFILAQRRAGRRAGLLPWVALLVGTAASLAANVAVGGHDPVGRALAGWPAISLLVSINCCSPCSIMTKTISGRSKTISGPSRTARTSRDRPEDRPGRCRTVQDDYRTGDDRVRTGRVRRGGRPGRGGRRVPDRHGRARR
jgi:hypothetical protein